MTKKELRSVYKLVLIKIIETAFVGVAFPVSYWKFQLKYQA